MDKKLSDKEKLEQVFGIHDSEEIDSFDSWTEDSARAIASSESLELSDKHWEVIKFLRIHFQNVGANMPPSHELSQTLEERFSDEGGLRYLYSLFPGGPLSQGSRIAGIPVPDDSADPSFGSAH